MKPDCANWKVWRGKEVEGTQGLGEMTLFIRSLEGFQVTDESDMSFLAERSKCKRVWFCKEFAFWCWGVVKSWKILENIAKHFEVVCLEVEPKDLESIPLKFREKFVIYLKVNSVLKKGDFVCVGEPYSDEAFEIGSGKKVNPKDYERDTRIV
jgi:hypothetical protein